MTEPAYHYGPCLFQAWEIVRAAMVMSGTSPGRCTWCGRTIASGDYYMHCEDGSRYHRGCFFPHREGLGLPPRAKSGRLPKVGPGKRRAGGKLPKVGTRKPKTFF